MQRSPLSESYLPVMASGSININTQILWLWVMLVVWEASSCEGQYHPAGAYSGGIPGYGAGPHYPTGMLPGPYHRPPISQTYGYGYSSSHMRAQEGSEEALDNAQKAAMEPMNNVMSSLPVRGDFVPYVPLSLSSVAAKARDASPHVSIQTDKPCGGSNEKCSEMRALSQTSNSQVETHKEQQQTQQQEVLPSQQTQKEQKTGEGSNRELPSTSNPCFCPCSYYSWMYGGFPFYDLSQLSYPKHASSQPYSAYSYYHPQMTSSRSARTFWLPWAQPAPATVQNPFGRPGGYSDPFYNRMYYSRRY